MGVKNKFSRAVTDQDRISFCGWDVREDGDGGGRKTVVAAATGFARGMSGLATPRLSSQATPGNVVTGTFIAAAHLRLGDKGRIAGPLPASPYLD
jgi:hypothetical protein